MAKNQRSFRLAVFWRMLLITAVPIVAMGLLTRTYIRQNTLRAIDQSSASHASLVAASAEAYLNTPRGLVINVSELLSASGGSAEVEPGSVLRSAILSSPSLEAILLLDRNGAVRAFAAQRIPDNLKDLDMSRHPGFILSRNTPHVVWAPASRSPWSNRVAASLAKRSGEQTVLAILSLEALQGMVAEHTTDDQIVVSLVDQLGVTFAHVGGSSEAPPLDAGRWQMPLPRQTITTRTGFGDEQQLTSATAISTTGWAAHVSQPLADAHLPVRRIDVLVLTLTLGAVIVVGVLAAMLASRLSRPVEILAKDAAAVAHGAYDQSLPAQPYDETEELAHTFREMAGTIRQRGDELLVIDRTLSLACSASHGSAFFSDVVGALATATGARCILITEWLAGAKPQARVIAARTTVALQDDFTYELGGNPCQLAAQQPVVHIASGVLREYPESPLMRLLGAEAYIAVPVKLSDGTTGGHLAVIDDHELSLSKHTRDLLLLLAARAGSELERMSAERRLHELESARKAVAQDQTELVCRTTIDGMITLANEPCCAWFGKRREELLGHSLMPMVHEEDRELVRSHFARLRPAYPSEVSEHRMYDAQGQVRQVRWTSRVIVDAKGRVLEYQITGGDVTALKAAEAAMAEAEQRFRLLADNSSTVLRITDWATHRTLYANAAYETVWGTSPVQTSDGSMAWTTAIHEEDRARVVRNFLLHAAESQFTEEYRIVRPGGTICWVRDKAVAIRERDGRVSRIVSVAEDITLAKLAAMRS